MISHSELALTFQLGQIKRVRKSQYTKNGFFLSVLVTANVLKSPLKIVGMVINACWIIIVVSTIKMENVSMGGLKCKSYFEFFALTLHSPRGGTFDYNPLMSFDVMFLWVNQNVFNLYSLAKKSKIVQFFTLRKDMTLFQLNLRQICLYFAHF